MAIKFIVTSYQRYSPDQESERTFEGSEIRIGRESDNDWVLSDPEKKLSRYHCAVGRQGDDYVLTDTSTNGVFLNHSDAAVGSGKQALLSDGDVLMVGDYELTVALIPDAVVTSEPPAPVDDEPPVVAEKYDLGLESKLARPQSTPSASVTAQPLAADDTDGFFEPPQPSSGEPLIPKDWDTPPEDDVGRSSVDVDVDVDISGSADVVEVEGVTPATEPSPVSESLDQPSTDATAMDAQQSSVSDGTVFKASVSEEPSGRDEHSEQSDASLDDPTLRAFLRGAGLPDFDLRGMEVTALMEAQGKLLRELVEGLMQGLANRRDIKDIFGLGHTQIRQTVNNPFKFLPTPDQTLKIVFSGGGPAYMEPLDAAEEGFRDLNAHQMAVIAGTKAAYRRLLERFEPEALEQRFGGHAGLVGVLSTTRKSRYWDLFKEFYAQIEADSEDDFEDFFGREFARAYKEAIRELSS